MEKERVVVVGNSSIDSILTKESIFYKNVCGGNCFHASMAASVITDNVAIVTNIPYNYPEENIAKLKTNGIDTSLIKRRKESVECEELFIYKENGDRTDGLFINPHNYVNEKRLNREEIEALVNLASNDSYSYKDFRLQYEPCIDSFPSEWKIASVHIAPTTLVYSLKILNMDIPIITLDPGKYIQSMEYEKIKDMVKKSTVFCPSKKEMEWIFSKYTISESVLKLGKDTNTNIVCKNGGDGCLVYLREKKKVFKLSSFPTTKIKNLTGAGDSFCGALNASLYKGYSVLDSVCMATIVASSAIESISALDRNKIDISYILKNYKKIKIEEVV